MKKLYSAILNKMTLEEKASLCSGFSFWDTQAINHLGIPSVKMTDGPHGLRKEINNTITNIMHGSVPATCFPPASTLCNSWDENLLEEVGHILADEAKNQAVSTILGPGINIKRSPLCGRNFEYFSEDPYLAGILGGAMVRGIQKNDVGVSLKHFCANNQEHIRMSVDSVVDERALREIYLSAFEHIVKKENPSTVMCSYNKLNGTYLAQNKRMLTDVLRNEWGFDGIVVSDWGAVNDRVKGIEAGLDLEMPTSKGVNDKVIINAVKNGDLDEKDLDKVVYRMIKFAIETKQKEIPDYQTDYDAHHSFARKVASECCVLLKNEDNLLPLNKDENLVIIGKLAKKLRYQGFGSSHINPTKTVSFTEHLDTIGKQYEYCDGYTLKGDCFSESKIKKAVKLAKGKDKVLLFVGLTDEYESEGYDRKSLSLPEGQNLLIEEISKVNKNIVLVLSNGSPVSMLGWNDSIKSILDVYLGGQAGGSATYDVLFGDINPSGKLGETFPHKNHDNISSRYFPMGPRNVQYRESIFVGYRYFDTANIDVLYPFGHGLSYTKFEYTNLKLSKKSVEQNEKLLVSFDIKNIGTIAGAEIAQLYVSDKESTIFKAKKELKGFKKVFLEAGEIKNMSIELNERDFSFYNVSINDWHLESGDFEILVGSSSNDIRLNDVVFVQSSNPDAPIPNYKETAPLYYDISSDEYKNRIPHNQFEALLGQSVEENKPYQKGEFSKNSTIEQISVTKFGKLIYKIVHGGGVLISKHTENATMVERSSKDLPLRSFNSMTGGMFSHKTIDGMVDIINSKKGGWKKFFKGFKKQK